MLERGKQSLETELFNGEYFIQKPDPAKGRRTLGSYNTCHIDQVFGQSWAWQVGLGRIIDEEKPGRPCAACGSTISCPT